MARTRRKDTIHRSFRLASPLVEHLARRADQAGTSVSALVERYLDEGIRIDEHPLIYFREGAAGRRPAVMGTRLDVWQVIETIRQNDNAIADAAEYLSLPQPHVEACVNYYLAYQDEIDEWTAREREAAEKAETSWRRRQAIFA